MSNSESRIESSIVKVALQGSFTESDQQKKNVLKRSISSPQSPLKIEIQKKQEEQALGTNVRIFTYNCCYQGVVWVRILMMHSLYINK